MDYLFSFILLHLFGMGLLDVINDVWIGDTTKITGTFYTTTTTTAALYIHIGQSSTIFHNSCKQGFVFSFSPPYHTTSFAQTQSRMNTN